MDKQLKIVALAGGVGGAKLADGLSRCFPENPITVVVNTGDDLELFGLHISPDLDTVCYTLAGLASPLTGWGLADESWRVFETLTKIGAPDWFRLGDKDLATHLERTRLLAGGSTLGAVTRILCTRLGVKDRVIPMSDQAVRTVIHTKDGREMGFQEYFVKEQCAPEVLGFEFQGISMAEPSREFFQALVEADLVVICPSNPWVSIDPIISLAGIRPVLKRKRVVAVSPIIGGKTIKGPAAKMYTEMGITPGCLAVMEHYGDFLSGFILDNQDTADAERISGRGIIPLVTNTIMRSAADRIQLAKEVIQFGLDLPLKGQTLV